MGVTSDHLEKTRTSKLLQRGGKRGILGQPGVEGLGSVYKFCEKWYHWGITLC
jgi:hypothetical protein